MDPPEIVPSGPNTSKYLDPPVQLLRSSAEVFEIAGLPWGPTIFRSIWTPGPNIQSIVPKYLDPQFSKQQFQKSVGIFGLLKV